MSVIDSDPANWARLPPPGRPDGVFVSERTRSMAGGALEASTSSDGAASVGVIRQSNVLGEFLALAGSSRRPGRLKDLLAAR
jgi:hypothetical protein